MDTYTLNRQGGKCLQSSVCNYGENQDDTSKCVRICNDNFFYINGACRFGSCPDSYKDNGFGGCISASVVNSRC